MKRALFVTVVGILGLAACRDGTPTSESSKPATPAPPPAVAPIPTPAAPATPGKTAANDPWTKAAPAKDPLPHPLFWSIEKDGITTYAIGTIHIGVDAEARLPSIVWDKLDAAK
ncbi:MAG: hypothetical protein ABI175_07300, partial [Polyangiales bacterium]